MRTLLAAVTLSAVVAIPVTARADDPPVTDPDGVVPIATTPAPSQPRDDDSLRHAEFSGGRLVAEILAGGLIGSLAGMAAYSGAGGDIGGALLGLGADFVVTPLVVWGTGKLLGGSGSLGYSYLGAAMAFSAPAASPQDAAIALSLGVIFMPVTSAVMYEVTSHVKWKAWSAHHPALSIAPIAHHDHVVGAGGQLMLSF